ncbi:hypothetical protein SUGI_1095410 [Cryptomeria japonica]|nr:hypothetical protein SUGI_1095410 [Cryptomeria japonica]
MAYSIDDWKMILATCALLICMIWDIALDKLKDCVRSVPSWMPSNIFVLNALTVLILGNVDIEKGNALSPSTENYLEVLVNNQLRTDAARLTMCVFVGCILPGVAIAGTEGRWSSVAALFVSLCFHVATEIYALHNANTATVEREAGPWFVSSGVLLSLAASSLLFLLGTVMLVCKIGRRSNRYDTLAILSQDEENEDNRWETLRIRVMKSWVVVRGWKTDYCLINSLFTPGAGTIVTTCVVVMVVKVAYRSSLLHHNNGGSNLTFYLQCIFILVGWIVMLSRWFTAALYFAKAVKKALFLHIAGTEQSFWKFNKKSFDRIKGRMDEGNKIAQNYRGLLSIMGNARLANNQHLRLDRNEGDCWMKAVSSIFSKIADAEIGVDMKDMFAAYRETLDVLKFVDCPDNIVEEPINIFGNFSIDDFLENIGYEVDMYVAEKNWKRGFGAPLQRNQQRVHELVMNLNALGREIFKITFITNDEFSDENVEELSGKLRTLVGRVIVSGLLEAPDLLIKHTRQWAGNLDEGKIERAVEFAGKVSRVLENLVEEGDIRSEEMRQVATESG